MLEQIEMGFRQLEPDLQVLTGPPKLSRTDIESAVTRALKEELDRLGEEETETPGESRASGTARNLIEP